jgi:hypothetical protein
VPKLKYDLRSSGISGFKYDLSVSEFDLSHNYAHGSPEATKLLADRYHVLPENVFSASEGATGQNTRVIRYLAEKNPSKNEAVVEYPTYESLLRVAQDYFPVVKRLERKEESGYRLDANELRRVVSEKTGLCLLTNSHAPSGAIADAGDLQEIMSVADEFGFFVVIDEIYAEFNRDLVPTVFSVDPEFGIVTTSFTKAYGLGGLRAGLALANKIIVDGLYEDALNTVGTASNLVEAATVKLLTEGKQALERHKEKWMRLKRETEKLLSEKCFEYLKNDAGVTYWVELPVEDTYRWVVDHTIPEHGLAVVPGAFFLFRDDYELVKSNMIRLGVGYVNPDNSNLAEAMDVLEKAVRTAK